MPKKKKKSKNSEKSFYFPADKCYIAYSPDDKLSKKSVILTLEPNQVKAQFGFDLWCDNLQKSVEKSNNCIDYAMNQMFFKTVPHEVKTNPLYSFVLHKISPKIGFGISTRDAIKKGTIIAEYLGEIKNIAPGDDSTYFMFLTEHTVVDAKAYGNVARFFHHCPSEHAKQQVMTANLNYVGCGDSGKTFFIALRDIKPFEPLCFDYGEEYGFDQNVELLNVDTYLPIAGEL